MEPLLIVLFVFTTVVLLPGFYLLALRLLQRPSTAAPRPASTMLDQTAELTREKQALQSYIDECKRVEEALRRSEEKYRALVENANDAIVIAQDGVMKFSNPKTVDMLGYEVDELARMPFTDIIVPEDRELVLTRYTQRLLGEEVPSRYQFRALTRQGEPLWVEINSVMVDWDGRPGTLCFLRDISEQKRAEIALRESERACKPFDNTSAVVYVKDTRTLPAGQSTFEELFHCCNEQIRGQTDFRIVSARNPSVSAHDQAVFKTARRFRLKNWCPKTTDRTRLSSKFHGG